MTLRFSDHTSDVRPSVDPGALVLAVLLVVLVSAWVALTGADEQAPADTLPPAVYVIDEPAVAGATAERVP